MFMHPQGSSGYKYNHEPTTRDQAASVCGIFNQFLWRLQVLLYKLNSNFGRVVRGPDGRPQPGLYSYNSCRVVQTFVG